MEYYFNELSVSSSPFSKTAIPALMESFAKTCIKAEKYGFTTLRTSIYFSEIEVIEGEYKLGDWMKDRSSGDRDLKRRLKSLDTKAPLIGENDEILSQFEYAIFKVEGEEALGLGAAYLQQSLAISFRTKPLWKALKIPLMYEYLDTNDNDEIIQKEVFVHNISIPEDLENHKEFIIERLAAAPIPLDWRPIENYLPNVEISNNILDIDDFYANNREVSRGERVAMFRLTGSQVAMINHYEFNKSLSDKNKSSYKLRDIYQSKNITGKTIYLSIDFEKGAFEVCDHSGTHVEEILFNGENNGKQELDHSIDL